MAKFVGTVQEFHHFIGPRMRNAINGITRVHRSQRDGVCELCERRAELQSAHVHGCDRRRIIERELRNFTDEQGIVSCALDEIEARTLQAHLPIETTFKFVCQSCHTLYDSNNSDLQRKWEKNVNASVDGDFPKLYKLRKWAKSPNQINHRIVRAFLLLECNGEVEHSNLKRYCTESLRIKTFDENYASMKTDSGNSHGRVFYNEGSKVKMWEPVRDEIGLHFSK